MTTRIILIRHGETAWNLEGRIQGHLQISLNERGLRQAEATAGALEDERVDAIYSSDLIRASCTAAAVARVIGLPMLMDPRLREWNLGVLSGLSKAECEEQHPDAYRIYRERDVAPAIPGGESIRARYRRVTGCISEIAARNPGGQVVVVSHGGPLGDCYRHATATDISKKLPVDLFNTAINRIQISDAGWSILSWGDIGHLSEIGSLANWEARNSPAIGS